MIMSKRQIHYWCDKFKWLNSPAPANNMSKYSPEWVESVKNKFDKSRKSNEMKKGLQYNIMYRLQKEIFLAPFNNVPFYSFRILRNLYFL
jgi:hypothetical protein